MRYKIVALIISPPATLSVIRSYPKNVHGTGYIAKQPRLKSIAKTKIKSTRAECARTVEPVEKSNDSELEEYKL